MPLAARHYVGAGRGRADDYYLTEGPGIARRYTAGDGRVQETVPLTGDAYEAWVAAAGRAGDRARLALTDPHRRRQERLDPLGPIAWAPVPAGRLADLERHVATAQHELAGAQARIARLAGEPALLGQPPDRLTAARDAWQARRDTGHPQRPAVTPGPASDWSGVPRPESECHGPRVTPGAASGLGR